MKSKRLTAKGIDIIGSPILSELYELCMAYASSLATPNRLFLASKKYNPHPYYKNSYPSIELIAAIKSKRLTAKGIGIIGSLI